MECQDPLLLRSTGFFDLLLSSAFKFLVDDISISHLFTLIITDTAPYRFSSRNLSERRHKTHSTNSPSLQTSLTFILGVNILNISSFIPTALLSSFLPLESQETAKQPFRLPFIYFHFSPLLATHPLLLGLNLWSCSLRACTQLE